MAEPGEEHDRLGTISSSLARIVSRSLEHIFIISHESGRYLWASEGALRSVGYTLDELREMTPLDLQPETDLREMLARIAPLLSGEQEMAQFEVVYRRKDGSRFAAEHRLQFFGSEPPPIFFIVARPLPVSLPEGTVDESVGAAPLSYRTIVETTHEGVWAVDHANVTTFVNRRTAEMLGYTVDEMIGKNASEFLDADASRLAEQHLERGRAGIAEQVDFRLTRKDGSELWALVKSQPMFDEDGAYTGMFVMFSDITERRRLEDGLREREAYLAAQLRAVAQTSAQTSTREPLPAPIALRRETGRLNARIDRAAQRFGLLADPNRLRLVHELASGEERTVSELTAAIGVSQSTASKHLKALTDAGLLQRRRAGAAVYYCLVDPTVPTLCFIVGQWLEVQARAEMQALAG